MRHVRGSQDKHHNPLVESPCHQGWGDRVRTAGDDRPLQATGFQKSEKKKREKTDVDRRVKETYPFQQTDECERLFERTQVKREARSQHFLIGNTRHGGRQCELRKNESAQTLMSGKKHRFFLKTKLCKHASSPFTCVMVSIVALGGPLESMVRLLPGLAAAPLCVSGVFRGCQTFLPLKRLVEGTTWPSTGALLCMGWSVAKAVFFPI